MLVQNDLPARGRRARVLARLRVGDVERIEQGEGLALRINAAGETTDRKTYSVPGSGPERSDPSLHEALLDLAYTVVADIREACDALENPEIWYPGVDEGIEPVNDEHVELVIWALQRELDREQRPRGSPRPPVPLSSLPWRIQRALVERRRLRFAQWGIGREEWDTNVWHPARVPEDPEWEPVS